MGPWVPTNRRKVHAQDLGHQYAHVPDLVLSPDLVQDPIRDPGLGLAPTLARDHGRDRVPVQLLSLDLKRVQ